MNGRTPATPAATATPATPATAAAGYTFRIYPRTVQGLESFNLHDYAGRMITLRAERLA